MALWGRARNFLPVPTRLRRVARSNGAAIRTLGHSRRQFPAAFGQPVVAGLVLCRRPDFRILRDHPDSHTPQNETSGGKGPGPRFPLRSRGQSGIDRQSRGFPRFEKIERRRRPRFRPGRRFIRRRGGDSLRRCSPGRSDFAFVDVESVEIRRIADLPRRPREAHPKASRRGCVAPPLSASLRPKKSLGPKKGPGSRFSWRSTCTTCRG